jgi:hypothetical protein
MGNISSYHDIDKHQDFEYFFRFIKTDNNFEELWRMKSSARESLREWLLSTHAVPKKAEVVSNSASELIENCIKYSEINSYSSVYIYVLGKIVGIETLNSSNPEQKSKIDGYIEFINLEGGSNPTKIYLEKITESIQTGKSQIGLLKVLMETQGTLEILEHKGEDKIVHLRVSMNA